MDIQEATKRVMSSIRRLDPENTTRIMGYIMIQDQGDKEMIRLAFFSDTALLSYVNQAKARLGITSSSSGGGNPCSNSSTIHTINAPFPQPATSPRIIAPNNGFHGGPLPSGGQVGNFSNFYGGGSEFRSDFLVGESGVGQLPYFDDSAVDSIVSPSGRSDSLLFPYGGGGEDVGNGIVPFHRRSCSVNDAAFFEDNAGGFDCMKPCMHFARGNCRNGSACKFSHSEFSGEGFEAGPPGSGFDDLLRIKALQQRFALMGSSGGHHNPFSSYNKCMSFLEGNPRNDFSNMAFGNVLSSSARQIYLTFPADSTFKEEDVTNYFNIFGPVDDVRIPYQQKRMFGFVSFVYPETVKLILAKGNPHFVCDSRVLVKPYKEKGKIPDKKHFRQLPWDKSDYLASLSPSLFDSRELYDLPVGPRMLNSQEMMTRRRFEQEEELHHAIERQSRKMMNLQLIDLNNQLQQQQHSYHFPLGLPAGISASSPGHMNHNAVAPSADAFTQDEVDVGQDASESLPVVADDVEGGESRLPASCSSFEQVLPDNPFTSPTKSDAEHRRHQPISSSDASTITSSNKTASFSGTSTINIASPCYYQMTSSH